MTREELIKEVAFPLWVQQAYDNGWGYDKEPAREQFEEDWQDWLDTPLRRKNIKLVGSMVKRAEIALSAIEAAGVTLCPNEPTDEMLDAARNTGMVFSTSGAPMYQVPPAPYESYCAMLAASPLKQGTKAL